MTGQILLPRRVVSSVFGWVRRGVPGMPNLAGESCWTPEKVTHMCRGGEQLRPSRIVMLAL